MITEIVVESSASTLQVLETNPEKGLPEKHSDEVLLMEPISSDVKDTCIGKTFSTRFEKQGCMS